MVTLDNLLVSFNQTISAIIKQGCLVSTTIHTKSLKSHFPSFWYLIRIVNEALDLYQDDFIHCIELMPHDMIGWLETIWICRSMRVCTSAQASILKWKSYNNLSEGHFKNNLWNCTNNCSSSLKPRGLTKRCSCQ